MAKVITEEHNGVTRTIVELEPGEEVSLCRCWQSGTFPFCDGKHKQIEGTYKPIRARAPKVETKKEDALS